MLWTVFTPLFETAAAPEQTPQNLAREVASLMTMAAVKLMGQDPTPLPHPQPVHREALVVGGGLAGMTAALGIADHGYGVCLVEQEENLGGLAMNLHYTLEGDDPRHYMEGLIEQVQKHPHIRIFHGRARHLVHRSGRSVHEPDIHGTRAPIRSSTVPPFWPRADNSPESTTTDSGRTKACSRSWNWKKPSVRASWTWQESTDW